MSWSLYLHIPYCETLCTFCGCNTTITKDHGRESPYVQRILKELQLYLDQIPDIRQRSLAQIHLGGGTPTFLSHGQLDELLKKIFSQLKKSSDGFEASIEVDPRRTNNDQLKVLRNLGFNRISLGVQDFNPEVQRLVNRIQPFEMTEKITTEARALGFESVNFDLIYGLAKQTPESMRKTVEQTIQLRPDRIALYSFALVPWIKPQQRLFKDEDLPKGADKRLLYEISREALLAAGYIEVGMDHFALPTDKLAESLRAKTLHRNFMGYTDSRTEVLLGLGVSAISETPESFHQNEKLLNTYEGKIDKGEIPTLRGHVLTVEDQTHREMILKLMTQYAVDLQSDDQATEAKEFLKEMIADGLVVVEKRRLHVTEKGKPFLRNACVFLDERLRKKQPEMRIFSQAI